VTHAQADAEPEPSADSLRAEIRALWTQHGLSTADFSLDQGGTLARGRRQTTGRAAFVSAMPATLVVRPVRRATVQDEPTAAPVTQETLIAAGGMGLVHEGHQRSLRRQVAVKSLKPEVDNPEGVDALLREAWLVGNLEHPNIVPIHLLDTSNGRSPQMVMKRIEGTTWAQLLKDPDLARSYGADDLLEFHLRILIQVCQAVRYAHSRDVLHLDIKPENVMAGHYDEVYLVDWGLAVSVAESCPAWMPHVAQLAAVCGTPGYIPPEMVAADQMGIGPRTDVYLLGAVLHEVISGSRRHAGDGVQKTLVNAYVSAPYVYDASVPAERCAGPTLICWRPMASSTTVVESAFASLVLGHHGTKTSQAF
jgi:hypothetical protein